MMRSPKPSTPTPTASTTPLAQPDPNGEVVPSIAADALIGGAASTGAYALTADDFAWRGLAGDAAGGAAVGGVGVVAAPIAASMGVGGTAGTIGVNAAAGGLGSSFSQVVDPAETWTPADLAAGAAAGGFGGWISSTYFPTSGMQTFKQAPYFFPRTWRGIWSKALDGNSDPNAMNAIYNPVPPTFGLDLAAEYGQDTASEYYLILDKR